MTDDDLDELLAPKPGTERDGLRQALLSQTQQRLARRVLVRRVGKLMAVAAVFGLGLVIGQAGKRPAPAVEFVQSEPVFVFVPVVVPVVPAAPGDTRGLTPPGSPATAAAAELLAEQADDRAEAARLYRLAGDKYLNDRQDYANAARCYRLFLTRAGDTALSPEPADTWLLTSLKNAAFKEKTDVAKTDG